MKATSRLTRANRPRTPAPRSAPPPHAAPRWSGKGKGTRRRTFVLSSATHGDTALVVRGEVGLMERVPALAVLVAR
jgi:hypothetical protein